MCVSWRTCYEDDIVISFQNISKSHEVSPCYFNVKYVFEILNPIIFYYYQSAFSVISLSLLTLHFQLFQQYLHEAAPGHSCLCQHLKTTELSWALNRADSDRCVSRGEISRTSEHSWRSILCLATGRRPLPFLIHPHIIQIVSPCPTVKKSKNDFEMKRKETDTCKIAQRTVRMGFVLYMTSGFLFLIQGICDLIY